MSVALPQLAPVLRFARAFTLALGVAAGASLARAAEKPETYRATIWNTSSGLPQGSINDLLQTADGELWIATFGGLIRFDGVTFRVCDLDTLPGLTSNRVTALVSDGATGLWFATQDGALARLDGGAIRESYRVPSGSRELLALARAPSGVLWIQDSGGGVFRFEAGTWQRVGEPGGEGHYDGVCVNVDGSVSAGVQRELVVYEPDGRERSRLTAPGEVVSVAAGPSGTWVGLANGLARVKGGTIERYSSEPALPLRMNSILDGGERGLWLGTSAGPVHLYIGPSSVPPVYVDHPLEMPRGFDVRCVLRDREGNLWLGSNGQGLVRLRPHRVERFGFPARRSRIVALCDDGDGGAWLANERDGLSRLFDGTWQEKSVPLRALDARPVNAQALLRDARGRVWLGFGPRVLRKGPRPDDEFVPVVPTQQWKNQVCALAETNTGEVWIASGTGKLVCVGADDEVRSELALDGGIVSLAGAPDGSLWVGAESRVHHVQGGRVETFDVDAGIPRGAVRDLLPDADGGVWIATYGGGLGHLAKGRARKFSRDAGLPDNSLSRIIDDGNGRLWILSNLGLIVLERAELDEALAGRRTRLEPVVVGPEAGVDEASFGAPAGFRDSAGRLWFSTIGGAVRIDPAEFPANRTAPTPRFERVHADERALPLEPVVTIPAGAQRIVFDYTTCALVAPERVRFRYRLAGFDDTWNDGGGARSASYTALAPGAYTFLVAARNEEGVWSDTPASLRIDVRPSWWQTSLFRIAAVLAGCGALLSFHRLRIRGVRRRAQALLAVTQQRRAAEEHAARLREELEHIARVATAGELATSLAHEVNQPLAAIVANAQAGRRFLGAREFAREQMDEILSDIAQQGQRASDVIRRLRAFLRKHPVERRRLDLNEIVRETLPLVRRELEDHRVRVELDLAAALPAVEGDPVELQQVLVNLVKNACEALSDAGHAAREGERRVRIHTRAAAGRVRLEVEDSGPGIDATVAARLFQPFTTTKKSGMGLGLAICRSIVEAHDGRLGVAPAPSGGALFHVELPALADAERGA